MALECDNGRWVCENHPNRPWLFSLSDLHNIPASCRPVMWCCGSLMRHLQLEPRAIHLRSPRRAHRRGLSLVWRTQCVQFRRPAVLEPHKITLGDMREMGVRGILDYCADYHCSHRPSALTAGPMRCGYRTSSRASSARLVGSAAPISGPTSIGEKPIAPATASPSG